MSTAQQNLVQCPLGPRCLSGTTLGHEPGSAELTRCQASANGTDAAATGDFNPLGVYSPVSTRMQRIVRQVKRAFGADGRGIPNLIGPPGIGKSQFVENLARSMGADCIMFDVSSVDEDVFAGIPYNPNMSEDELLDSKGRERIRIAGRLYEREVVDIFFRDKDAPPAVVFLDEFSGGKEAVMSSLQKILTSRMLAQEGRALNDDVFFIAAMNDAEHTSNGSDLSAAMVSRTSPIAFRPNFEEWAHGEMSLWGKGYDSERAERVARALGENAPTRDQQLQAATYVISYLDEMGNPELEDASGKAMNLFNQPLDEGDLTKKVGQPRSWSKAISGMAAALANQPEDAEPGDLTRDFVDIIAMNCGSEAARDFADHFETRRELPDLKGALKDGAFGDGVIEQWKAQARPDIAMYATAIITGQDYEGDPDQLVKAIQLVSDISKVFPDIATPPARKAITRWIHKANEVGGDAGQRDFTLRAAKVLLQNPEFIKGVDVARLGASVGSGGASTDKAGADRATQAVRSRQAAKANSGK